MSVVSAWAARTVMSATELRLCTLVAIDRRIAAVENGAVHRAGKNDKPYEHDFCGACAECVVARYRNVYWPANGNRGSDKLIGDVDGLQVRWRPADFFDLILRPGDDDEHRFVLVTGAPPALAIRGWCFGHEGKAAAGELREGPREDMRPCWWVPQSILKPLERGGHP